MLRCHQPTRRSGGTKRCPMPAGWGTKHPGFGHCSTHGGASKAVEEAWHMALEMAREDPTVSPWEALLRGVSRAVARSQWVDTQLREAVKATDGGDPIESRNVQRWLKESRLERALMGRTAQAAIQAGVAERLVRNAEMEGRMLAAALDQALDALPELTPEQRFRVIEAAHEHLLGADTGPRPAPPPELTTGTDETPDT
jgi:hypothetical protein